MNIKKLKKKLLGVVKNDTVRIWAAVSILGLSTLYLAQTDYDHFINETIDDTQLTVPVDSVLKINGPIRDVMPLIELKQVLAKSNKEVTIILNTPGGLVSVALAIVNTIQEAQSIGIKVNCIVDGMAASAGAFILSYCSARYGTIGSKVLWHSALTSVSRINQSRSQELADYFEILNDALWGRIARHFTSWYFEDNFLEERFIPVGELEREGIQFIKVIKGYNLVEPAKVKKLVKVRIHIPRIKKKGKKK